MIADLQPFLSIFSGLLMAFGLGPWYGALQERVRASKRRLVELKARKQPLPEGRGFVPTT